MRSISSERIKVSEYYFERYFTNWLFRVYDFTAYLQDEINFTSRMKKAIVWSTNNDSNDQVVKLSSVCENSRLFVFHKS